MDQREDKPMVVVEKARVNAWNIAGFLITVAVAAFGWGVTYNSMTNANEAATKDIAALSAKVGTVQTDVKELQTELPQMQSSIQRLTEIAAENRAAIKASNDRIDRIVESFGGKLDGIVANVNKIATQVEVLAARFGERPATPQRTRFSFGTLKQFNIPEQLQPSQEN